MITTMAEPFAQKLRRLRKAAGLSQEQLARKADISLSAVRHYETGKREPSWEMLRKLADGLGVKLAAFDDEPAADAGQGDEGE